MTFDLNIYKTNRLEHVSGRTGLQNKFNIKSSKTSPLNDSKITFPPGTGGWSCFPPASLQSGARLYLFLNWRCRLESREQFRPYLHCSRLISFMREKSYSCSIILIIVTDLPEQLKNVLLAWRELIIALKFIDEFLLLNVLFFKLLLNFNNT